MSAGEAFDPSPDNIALRTKTFSLPGGAKFSFLTKFTRGETVEGRITYRIGDEKTLMNKSSVAALTAALLRLGTTKYSRQQLNDELDKLKSSVNISGSGQTVQLGIQSTKENLPAVLDLVNDMVHNPSFDGGEFRTLVDEQIAALEVGRSEPEAIAIRELNRIGNSKPKGHPLYVPTLDEDLSNIKAVTVNDLKDFYKNFYTASNATAAFVGDFNMDAVKSKVEQLLSGLNATNPYKRVEDTYEAFKPEIKEIKTPDKKNAVAMGSYQIKMRDTDPDFAALTMADFVLGGGFLNSRLASRIRQKEGISYGVMSQFSASPLDDKAQVFTGAIYNPENKGKLMSAFKEEYEKLANEGITEAELKDAKKCLVAIPPHRPR